MQDQPHHPLGHLAGTEVGVQPNLSGQDILIRRSEVDQRLACLLSPVAVETDRLGDALYWCIPHDRGVDQLLTELIDLFISIRYNLSWPKMHIRSKTHRSGWIMLLDYAGWPADSCADDSFRPGQPPLGRSRIGEPDHERQPDHRDPEVRRRPHPGPGERQAVHAAGRL